jgi:hypothetical protein
LEIETLEERQLLASGPQIFLTASVLSALQQQAVANTPQWAAFKANLDAGLAVLPGGNVYQASELGSISDYALGYQILQTIDPVTAAKYADKAIALMKSALFDFQKDGSITRQFLARGNGTTTSFTLPNPDLIPSSLQVYLATVTTQAAVHGALNGQDSIGLSQKVLKISNTPDGNPDYLQGTDWFRNPNLSQDLIDWSGGSKQPGVGATYYVTSASGMAATPVNVTLNGNTITFATAPGTNQAIFVEYIYGTHASNYSTLAYQMTSAGDGGFNSIFIDTTYTSRYLGKHVAMGLDWLWNYPGLSATLKSQAINVLIQWFNYVQNNGYYNTSPESNYGAGGYVSLVMTALAVLNRDPSGSTLLSQVINWRQNYLIPALSPPANGNGSLSGGFWAEGWNYGALAAQNLLLAGLALESAGQIPAAMAERTWASQAIRSLISSQPTANTVYDGGDWYAFPAPLPGNTLFTMLAAAANDPVAQSYANYFIQNRPNLTEHTYLDLLFQNPSAPASFWGSFPLQYYADGTGLATARADWSYNSTWLSFQLGNELSADHQNEAPGQLQIQMGANDLLINANALGGNQDIHTKSSFSNLVAINDNGAGFQNYPWNVGFWYGTPGVFISNYEATANYVYVGGDYTAAYSLNTNPGGGGPATQLTRQVVYLRPDFIIVHDRAGTLQASFAKQLQWHFLNPVTVTGNSWVETVGSSSLFADTFSSVPLTTTTYPVTVPYGSTAYRVATNNINPALSVQYTTALETAPSSVTSMVSTLRVVSTNGAMEGVQEGSDLVLFGVNGPINATSISYSVSGSGSVYNLLTDLQPNQVYKISANGVVLTTLTASAQGTISFTTPAGTTTVTVTTSAAATSHLNISAPASATAGSSFSITVTALDANNSTLTSYLGTVQFTTSDSAAILPSNYAFTAADAGVHTFTGIVLKTAGSQSVMATDTVTGSITGSASVTVNPAAASTLVVSGYSSPTTAGTSHSFTVTAQDAYGNKATGYLGTVSFTSSDGQAVLPANYTFSSIDAGVHSFSATLKTAGSKSITAKDTASGSINGSQTGITVNAAAASKLVVGGYPSSTTAGVSHSFTVTAQDAFGNTATGYTGTLTFTSSDSQALLPANYKFANTDAGVHSFSATLKTAGNQSITATDTVTATITGVQSGITVNAAATSHFSLGAPTSGTAGSSFAITVTALDANNKTLTNYLGTIQFSSSDAVAVLPGSYTFTAADAGVHTFTGIVLKTAGSQSITATDTATGSITGSASVTVNPAAASTLIVTGYPSPTTAGTSHGFTVTADDAYGNKATGYVGTVRFTSGDGQALLPANYTFTIADAGVHSFSATLKTAGTQSITATDSVTSTIQGNQTGITVNPAAASKLVVSGYTSPTTASTSHSFTVTAKDTFGNTASGYTGTVAFTSSDAKAILPANYTFVSGDAGVHSFSATLKTAGTQSITTKDTVTASITGTESGITVNAAAVSSLHVTAPPSVKKGRAFTITVTAVDASNNIITTYLGTIHFTSSDSQAVLPANYTFTASDAGVHVFTSGVTLPTSGSQTVTATDTANGSLTGQAVVKVGGLTPALFGRVSTTGQWWAAVSNGSSAFTNAFWASWSPNVTWVDVQTGDFTGDGHQDIVGRDLHSGQWWVAQSNGSTGFTNSLWDTWSTGVTWVDVHTGDFNGDGKTDIVGRALETGQWWVAQSTGSSFVNRLWTTWSPAVTWVDVKVGDFNGDGKADITGRTLEGGQWWTGLSTGSSFTTSLWATWSTAVTWVDVNVGDFDGDGKADITGRTLQGGHWWTGLSTGSSFATSLWDTWSTAVTWVDVKVGDFNGDGKSDIIGRTLQGGQWWVGLSTGSSFSNSLWATWSTAVTWVDVQVGDFNGDGKSDITGRVLQNGQWWTGVSNGAAFITSLWASWSSAVNWVDVQVGNYS